MRRAILLFYFMILFTPLVVGYDKIEYPKNHSLQVTIRPDSTWIYKIDKSGTIFYRLELIPANNSLSYNIKILNETQGIILSWNNFFGEFKYNFVYDNKIELQITNDNTKSMSFDTAFFGDEIIADKNGGYSTKNSLNRFWIVNLKDSMLSLVELKGIKTGDYIMQIGVSDLNGYIGIYVTEKNPLDNDNWKEGSSFFTCRNTAKRDLKFNRKDPWIVFSSLDSNLHIIYIGFFYNQENNFGNTEIGIVLALFLSLIFLFAINVGRKKKRKSARFRTYKPDSKRIDRVLRLSSQVDWRYEGGRYAYIPPDVTNPHLLDPSIEDD